MGPRFGNPLLRDFDERGSWLLRHNRNSCRLQHECEFFERLNALPRQDEPGAFLPPFAQSGIGDQQISMASLRPFDRDERPRLWRR